MSVPSALRQTRVSKSEAASSFYSSTEKMQTDSARILTHQEPEIIWPEWSDADINAEKWGASLEPSKAGGKGKAKSPKKEKKGKSSTKTDASPAKTPEIEQYEDHYPTEIPWSLHKGKHFTLKRPQALFPDVKIVIYSETAPTCADLISGNRHLLESEFIRSFISATHILSYIGYKFPFEVEWQTIQFSANTSNIPWEPWHHLYSLGRAGGTSQHAPMANNLGKYVVRLFWLGCWRKILLDDKLPVDATGQLLLPITTTSNNKELELWPMLLSKALMKIASLSWTNKQDIIDFDIITCLTGWAMQKICTKGLDITDKWDICCSYSDHFTWNKSMLNDKSQEKEVEPEKSKKKEKGSKKSKSVKSDKAKASGPEKTEFAFHLIATICDLRNYENILEDITPCWSHDFLLEATRSIPLVKKVSDITEELAPWKVYRWLDWAIDQGMWDADYTLDNKSFIKIISNMRKVNENFVYDLETSYREKCVKISVDAFNKFLEIRNAAPKSGKQSPVSSPTKEKKDKSILNIIKFLTKLLFIYSYDIEAPKIEKFIDPSIWCYFNSVGEYIHSLSIYIKPSCFKSRYVLTNFKINGPPLPKKGGKKDSKKGKAPEIELDAFKHIYWENILLKTRNDTMYLFTDSIDYRLIIFTLAHIGKEFPDGLKDVKFPNIPPLECKKNVCISGKCIEDCYCRDNNKRDLVPIIFTDKRRTANIIIEDFDWTSRQTGEMSLFLKTFGTSSLLFKLPKGRFTKRIWVNADPAFCLHILCDDPNIKIGKCDEIIDRMATESELLMKSCYQVCSAFGNLVRYFTTPSYPAALKLFYKSYLPEVALGKTLLAQIHDCFMKEFINILTEVYPETLHYDVIRAMRILLLDPNIRIPYTPEFQPYLPKDVSNEILCDCVDTNIDAEKAIEKAAVKIQSVFKTLHMKRLIAIHDLKHPKLPRIVDFIKSIYVDIFSSKNRETYCLKLLRGMVINKQIKDLASYFPYYKDLKFVVDTKHFNGDINEVKYVKWMPVLQRNFYCHCNSAYMRPYIFSNLPGCMVRIFNNETGTEINRYTNNALVHKYEKNKKGYTLLVYGTLNESIPNMKTFSWKIIMVMQKILVAPTFDVDSQTNFLSQLQGNYLPNLDNLVCTIQIKVQQSSKATFHLQASSPNAQLKMECISKQGTVLDEAYGLSNVIIPVKQLLIEDDDGLSDSITQDNAADDKNAKNAKKTKGQRRASSKSIALKEKTKKNEKDSQVSLNATAQASPSPSIYKKKVHSLADGRQSIEYTTFSLRVTVLKDTWPLTTQEWEVVNKLRKYSNVEDDLYNPEVNSSISLMSNNLKKAPVKNTSRRPSKLREVNNVKPFWIFSTFFDAQKKMFVSIDDSRINEIKDIKRSIILSDPRRYFLGKNERFEFLQQAYLKWTPPPSPTPSDDSLEEHLNSSEEDEESKRDTSFEIAFDSNNLLKDDKMNENKTGLKQTCRECQKEIDPAEFTYLEAPDSRHKMLPPFEVNKYNEKIVEYRWPVDKEREEKILDDVNKAIEDFEQKNNEYIESMNEYLTKTHDKYKLMHDWYKVVREESLFLMRKNDAKRDYYINKRAEEASAAKSQKKK